MMEIIWTRLAKITFLEILENLTSHWTQREVKSFIRLTNRVLEKISSNRISTPIINTRMGIRRAIVHKNVSLFYKEDISAKRIYLITFFNNRMNPKTLKKLLRSW